MANNLKQVIINISAKDFVIKCSDEFADFLEDDIALLSNGTKKMELKSFVDAFVKKSYQNYTLQKKLQKLIKTMNENINTNSTNNESQKSL
ncbi:hypothetical protein [Campylobacter vulpis]|uniref:Uncharacterized protein n=1 Tax=Campylobacter vulpis TaxID=1655500 RepID=A0A2G4R7H2_9BACT|nr:hypothetical protein [Campylobacter vulpis]MBS4234930.1 hypothetical protein [Campylobacter vulpis]MBS4240639.1 hypothetical protein [Campylobacter vulpis]MBS4252077.1 hypothetical protein [Campylobacter vulpis]MBS4268539.1 hypothetical protein [Campylobacter vulpis]MBS4275014.1 hypothetical protein [Campylobacter vulpis]